MNRVIVKDIMVNIDIHARPAAQIMGVLEKFATTLQIIIKGEEYSISSMLELLMININKGSVLTIIFVGEKAQLAADSVLNILKIPK